MRVPWSVLAVLGLLLFLPLSAVAQTGDPKPMTVTVESPDGLFDPLDDNAVATIPITVKVDCLAAKSDAPINFTVRDKPDWLWVRSMPGWFTTLGNYTGYAGKPCDQETGYVTVTENMQANFTTDAPAYRFANFTVVVTRSNTIVSARGAVQPGYWGELEVVGPPNVVRIDATETKVDVPFRVRNYGNGATTVTLTYQAPPEVRIDGPDVMRLGASQQGGDWDQRIPVTVFLNGYTEDFTVEVTATGVSRNESDPVAASAATGSTDVDVRADFVPGPAIALVAIAAAGAAIAVARRRLE